MGEPLPAGARALADKLYGEAARGQIVKLLPLTNASEKNLRLAADSFDRARTPIVNLATFYSTSPEIVLRLMRDLDQGSDYLQLIGMDPKVTSHVLVQLPEIGREFATDDFGKAVIGRAEFADFEKLKWQIKLPDALFLLEPLIYDPDWTTTSKEVTIESEQGDRIRVTLEDKVEGKQILIRVLEFDGKAEFGEVRVMISQHEITEIKNATPDQTVLFETIDPGREISIRLFH